MTCKDFSGMIPAFMKKELPDPQMRGFLAHYRQCAYCREELEIHYLIDKAFEQMEVGEEVNLSRDIPLFIEEQQKGMEHRTRVAIAAYVMEGIAVCLAVFTVVVYLL